MTSKYVDSKYSEICDCRLFKVGGREMYEMVEMFWNALYEMVDGFDGNKMV